MAIAEIDEVRAVELCNNIGIILDGEKPHTAMAAVAQSIKILSLTLNMSFEDMVDDLSKINDVLYDDATFERREIGDDS
ncbi:hypothetical protein [Sulfurimonas sp.]